MKKAMGRNGCVAHLAANDDVFAGYAGALRHTQNGRISRPLSGKSSGCS